MKIKCHDCGYLEEVNIDLFVKLIAVAMPAGGFWAWTTFLFAGTGLAMPIVIAIMSGGVAMLVFKDKIVEWIISKGYLCPDCGGAKWDTTTDEVEQKLKDKEDEVEQKSRDKEDEVEQKSRDKDSKITKLQEINIKYEKEMPNLKSRLGDSEKKILEYVKNKNECFSYDDVEDLFSELKEKDNKIEQLLHNEKDWENHKKSLLQAQEKVAEKLNIRFKICYPSLTFTDKSLTRIARLNDKISLKLEKNFGLLQHEPKKINFRDKIFGTDVVEIEFNRAGRLYIKKFNGTFKIVCVGDKKSQKMDLKWLRENYRQ